MKNNDRQTELTGRFAALGDPIRFAIVERLLTEGEVSAGDLGAAFDVTAPAVSRHLSVLHRAGLVRRRVDRQRRLYSVDPDSLRVIAGWIERHHTFWEGMPNFIVADYGGGAVETPEEGESAMAARMARDRPLVGKG
jgi:DNA-binding transcriptional ArsR family regulator